MANSKDTQEFTVPSIAECCGDSRSTPYCPLCGKELAPEGSVVKLLAYLHNQSRTQRKELAALNPTDKKYEAKKKVYLKWANWAAGVAKLLEQHGVPDIPEEP